VVLFGIILFLNRNVNEPLKIFLRPAAGVGDALPKAFGEGYNRQIY
jgi:hypothetical protein